VTSPMHSPDIEILHSSSVELALEQNLRASETSQRFSLPSLEPRLEVLFVDRAFSAFAASHRSILLEIGTCLGSVAAMMAAPFTPSTLRTMAPSTLGSPMRSSR